MGSITPYDTAAGKRWRVRYRKPDRSQTDKRGFTTKHDAELFLASVTVAKATGEYIDPALARVTVGRLGIEWLQSHQVKAKPSTHSTTSMAWRVHVEPRWGTTLVASISPSEVASWVSELQAGTARSTRPTSKPLSATSVLRAHGVLAGILDRAVADRRIPSNPARGVPLPRKRKHKQDRNYLDHRQVELLAQEAGRQGTLVRFLAFTGLRWGEAIALRVGDVDEIRSRVHVRQNAPRVDGRHILGTPKTHEARAVALSPFLLDELRRATAGRGLHQYVFGAGDVLLQPSTHRDGWFAQARRRATLLDPHFPSTLTVHDLRHTAASLAISSGANVKAVQRMLGHASAAMTLDTYADLFDDDLAAVATSLELARARALEAR